MKRIVNLTLCLLLILIIRCGNIFAAGDIDTRIAELDAQIAELRTEQMQLYQQKKEAGGNPIYQGDSYTVEYVSGKIGEFRNYPDTPSVPAVIIKLHFQNFNDYPLTLYSSAAIQAFQDGMELEFVSLNSDSIEAENSIKEIMQGAELDCLLAFETISDSPVEIRIGSTTYDPEIKDIIE